MQVLPARSKPACHRLSRTMSCVARTQDFRKEVEIMRKLRHPNIVEVIACACSQGLDSSSTRACAVSGRVREASEAAVHRDGVPAAQHHRRHAQGRQEALAAPRARTGQGCGARPHLAAPQEGQLPLDLVVAAAHSVYACFSAGHPPRSQASQYPARQGLTRAARLPLLILHPSRRDLQNSKAKLADFGLSHMISHTEGGEPGTGCYGLAGTPCYM